VKLEQLLACVDPTAVAGACRGEVRGVVCDSRQVREGYVFVAIPGHHQDGWLFADDAARRGARALVSQHPPNGSPDICRVQVSDARCAAAELAAAFHGHPADKLQVIGITGTNGKTTTAFMTRAVLQGNGRHTGLVSTVAYEIGMREIPAVRTTPEAPALQAMLAEMVSAGCRCAVMEVSSHALDQQRTAGIDFDVAVFTNLTLDHLDYHTDMEQYFAAKSRLFTGLAGQRKAGTAVVNRDDPWGRRLLATAAAGGSVLTYGLEGTADVRAAEISLAQDGSTFTAHTPWGTVEVRLDLLGRYNISNALAALAAAGALGVDPAAAAASLAGMQRVPGRLEVVPTGRGFQVFVDYAHTDDALQHVLTTLREIAPRRLLVVFGCGGSRDAGKRPRMGAVAARLADYSVLTSDNPRKEAPGEIIAQVREGFADGGDYEVSEDRRAAIGKALAMAEPGDIVLIAGKGHETFQEFADKTVMFDDRQVVREMLAELV